ncbi:hypothetical protein ACGFIF_35615 [Kribbella sp. NPDC049174]|uniref:hypothetical protein n=1 Tax=Kribbella sp. NPDC049174 TaxID=3364112 RepID=UPI00371039A3
MVAFEAWSFPVPWFLQHSGLAVGAMVLLLGLTCLLTWLDPIIRARQVPPVLAVAGWVAMAAVPTLLRLFGEGGPAALFIWGVAGLYALSIFGTLGRPLLIFSDLLEDAESEGSRISASDWRRSRIGQRVLICGICAAVAVVMATGG